MVITDFKVGQIVYVLNTEYNNIKVTEKIVKSIGRKYLKASYLESNTTTDYMSSDTFEEGLIENKDWGTRDLLFPTKQALDDYNERCELNQWLKKVVGNYKSKFTLKQLRAIKKLIEEE